MRDLTLRSLTLRSFDPTVLYGPATVHDPTVQWRLCHG
jgi:hypothetical protein